MQRGERESAEATEAKMKMRGGDGVEIILIYLFIQHFIECPANDRGLTSERLKKMLTTSIFKYAQFNQ
jgi:hypothetical protein